MPAPALTRMFTDTLKRHTCTYLLHSKRHAYSVLLHQHGGVMSDFPAVYPGLVLSCVSGVCPTCKLLFAVSFQTTSLCTTVACLTQFSVSLCHLFQFLTLILPLRQSVSSALPSSAVHTEQTLL